MFVYCLGCAFSPCFFVGNGGGGEGEGGREVRVRFSLFFQRKEGGGGERVPFSEKFLGSWQGVW